MNTSSVHERLAAGLGLAVILVSGTASAASLDVEVTLPNIASAAYHPPYLAAWIERPGDPAVVATLAVWYDTRLRDQLGKIFLKELRTWWRKAGSSMSLPADGVSGPTRGAGVHTLRLSDKQEALAALPPGNYQVVVEVAREQGGRSVLRAPFSWKGDAGGNGAALPEGEGGELAGLKVAARP